MDCLKVSYYLRETPPSVSLLKFSFSSFEYTKPEACPPAFEPFTRIPSTFNTLRISNMTDFTIEIDANTPNGNRQHCVTATFKNNATTHEKFFDIANQTLQAFQYAEHLVYTISFQPLSQITTKYCEVDGEKSLGLVTSGDDLVNVLLGITWSEHYLYIHSDLLFNLEFALQMHTNSLLLLALTAQSLSYPSPNSTLLPHSSRGWIGTYDDDDTSCTHSRAQDNTNDERPFVIKGTCVPFNPQSGRIGLDWGVGGFRFGTLTAYVNNDCTGNVQAVIKNTKGTFGDCFALEILGCKGGESVGNYCLWLSVRGS